ncbi:type III pantothenate kinase [Litoribacter populi]|uniref:type III pantothenate kinase n=1 Tax=Litoribacter populi TaxID=2598460 RepID=UPI00117CD10D|nr:type III pantothenate kinase [Litoribacter populi]
MFLAIDIGNSNIVFGLYDLAKGEWKAELRIETRPDLLVSSLQDKMHLYFLEKDYHVSDIDGIGVSSVVPELNATITEFCKSFFAREPHIITGKSYDTLKVKVARPDEIGTDLMSNVTAAYERYQQATIIVDFGTALTFTIIGKTGEVLGVNIVPGIKTAIKSLSTNTAKLPEVSLEWPDSVVGKGTVHSIQAGILYGYTGLVKGMLADIKKELKEMNFKIIATGGLSSILVKLEGEFDEVDRNLTLEGIRLIAMENMKKGNPESL